MCLVAGAINVCMSDCGHERERERTEGRGKNALDIRDKKTGESEKEF